MINEFEQTLLLSASALILLATLVVWVVAYVRRNRDRDDDPHA
ncbi:hypothetical protein AB1K54_13555 [Microbacterium sp. BWT-B31]